MMFGPSGRDHDSQNHLFEILATPIYFKTYKKIPNRFGGHIIAGIYQNLGTRFSKNIEKARAGNH